MLISLLISVRADLLRAAPILAELRRRQPGWTARLIHAGRADDNRVTAALLQELDVATPDACLGVERGPHLAETTGMMAALHREFDAARPNAVMVFGDSSATVAGALASAQLGIPLAHVEAGLRNFNRRTPGEINRVVADALCEWLFTSERGADVNLRAEGLPDRKIHFVGSTTVDSLVRHRSEAAERRMADTLGLARPYVVVALSKPENVENALQRRSIAYALVTLADEFDVVWSVNPGVVEQLRASDVNEILDGHHRLRLLSTVAYLEFISLLTDSAAVLTDSGTVQEQAVTLGASCVTLSHYTKHPVTLTHGGNRLAGADPHLAARYIREAIRDRSGLVPFPEGWDGHAAARIVDVLERDLATTP